MNKTMRSEGLLSVRCTASLTLATLFSEEIGFIESTELIALLQEEVLESGVPPGRKMLLLLQVFMLATGSGLERHGLMGCASF